ncbi:mannitol dehydrogenase family protein [Streptosporangium sp. NBC_01756]|uniref:mannitol dehydrogenase family protein n=1 Tax=Streptosporangium sp. NBC_01756 TaxID=2975950 RepID=UPI002DD857F7|nr:mannitol dehydrogenase family protein [Streptosporangium sp. NBC_01756]WSC89515.1 mannitol dehydrogenase family protein [Streptosporangium sp. NBC_01756]
MRLSRATLSRVAPAARPLAEPRVTGVVHLGIGAFHRAHQAVYTERAMAVTGDDRWGICGASQRSTDVVDRLRPQDCLYGVRAGDEVRVVGSVREVLAPGDDLAARLAAPETAVVTLTITEKGYRRDPLPGGPPTTAGRLVAGPSTASGRLVAEPSTMIGRLVAGLRARAAADAGPLTVVSCDNLPDNGATLAGLVAELCEPRLLQWVEENVRFPATMVDRIVPATTQADLDDMAVRLGVTDLGAVATEPFTQWVIEDSFAGDRPAWDRAGALLVDDVRPYERMKLRLLNGGHSAIAYLSGAAHVSEAVGDPAFTGFLRRLMDDDLSPTLDGLDGFDLAGYKESLLTRFANPGLRHRVAQIAADGSQKLPQRLLDPARDRLAGGHEPRWIALVVAGWMRHVTTARELDDPLADRLRGDETASAAATVKRLLAIEEIFGADLREHRVFRELVTDSLERLDADGVPAALRALAAGPS